MDKVFVVVIKRSMVQTKRNGPPQPYLDVKVEGVYASEKMMLEIVSNRWECEAKQVKNGVFVWTKTKTFKLFGREFLVSG
jgi:hypothetical protein